MSSSGVVSGSKGLLEGDRIVDDQKNAVSVFTFGRNDEGQLGIGKTLNDCEFVSSPHSVQLLHQSQLVPQTDSDDDDDENDVVDANKQQAILFDTFRILDSACGGRHCLILVKNQNTKEICLFSWGENEDGQCVNGTDGDEEREISPQYINITTNIASVINSDSNHGTGRPLKLFCTSESSNILINLKTLVAMNEWFLIPLFEETNNNSTVGEKNESEEEVQQISLGGTHALILFSNGDILVGGNNDSGQLGLDNTDDKSDKESDNSDSEDDYGKAFALLNPSSFLEKGDMKSNSQLLVIGASQDASFFIFDNNHVYSCGKVHSCETGHDFNESTSDIFIPKKIVGIPSNFAIGAICVSCSSCTIFLISEDNRSVIGWGDRIGGMKKVKTPIRVFENLRQSSQEYFADIKSGYDFQLILVKN